METRLYDPSDYMETKFKWKKYLLMGHADLTLWSTALVITKLAKYVTISVFA